MTAFIGVLIGLFLLYLLMSILCSYLKEAVAAVIAMRAEFLELGLRRMVQADVIQLADVRGNSFDLVQCIFAHPLIQSLSQSSTNKPTYIPDHVFVAVLESVLAEKLGTGATLGEIVTRLPLDSPLTRSLLAMIRGVENDPDLCRLAVAAWFNDTMDRVSGWYKRRAQIVLFVVGLMIAVAFNADSFSVASKLWNDTSLRDAVAVVATEVLRTAPRDIVQPQNPPAPVPPARAPSPPEAGTSAPANPDTVGKEQKVVPAPQTGNGSASQANDAITSQTRAALKGAQQSAKLLAVLPIGWDDNARAQWDPGQWRIQWQGWLIAILGWILTAVAASLGAPFWFDLLGKAINMRFTGPVPRTLPGTQASSH